MANDNQQNSAPIKKPEPKPVLKVFCQNSVSENTAVKKTNPNSNKK